MRYDKDIAVKYGDREATLIQFVGHWTTWNENHKYEDMYHDGNWWLFAGPKVLEKYLPMWSSQRSRYYLRKLEKLGLVIVGRYNKKKYDKTKWYRLSDKAHKLWLDKKQTPKKKG